jgi:DNA (cytosine-5)-methyltransferase 1
MLDLFSGIGGFSLAASWVWGDDLDLAGFCELDAYCGKVLKKNFPDVPIYPDIKELRGEWFRNIDLITGGFPCQDISVAGKGAGIDGDRSGLWSEMCRVISEVRPRYALIENVPMLIHRGLERVLLDLAEIGYDAEWQIIGADDVGARHKRKRIWIVAYPDSTRLEKHGAFNPDLSWRSGKTGSGEEPEEKTVAYPNSDGTKRDQPSNGQRGGIMENGDTSRETMAHTDNAGSGASADGTDGNGSQENQGRHRQPFAEPGRHGETMAHTQHAGRHDTGTVPHTASVGSSGSGQSQYPGHQTSPGEGETANFIDERIGDIWAVEPDVGRVANGVPKRVDRLRGLGNAIVPQVAALIMQMIKDDIWIR